MSHEISVLRELVVLAGASLAVVMLFGRLRLPAAVGFIFTGVLIGPGGFGVIRDPALVETLAQFGVVILLFTVGLEFSLTDLGRLGRRAAVGGGLQIAITVALVAGPLLATGMHPARAVFFGVLLALSSTALVLKLLTDRLELASPHGRLTTGVLVFQDVMLIPLAMAVVYLARWHQGGAAAAPGLSSVLNSLALLAAIGLVFFTARRAVPWMLIRASRTHSREVFLFAIVLVALGSAFLGSLAGLSLALGAFMAGVILAESDLRSRIAAEVLPFRDALSSVFFISIGMLFEPRTLLASPLLVAASTVGLVAVKTVGALVALRLAGTPWRVALAGGLSLAQVGEFSFVLAQAGDATGLLGDLGGQAFYAGAVFSLMLTPLLVTRAPGWALSLDRMAGARAGAETASDEASGEAPPLASHVVIAGFGLNGRNLARVLRAVRIPHLVVDLDPASAQSAVSEGSRALVGDIVNPQIQQQAGVHRARTLVLALSDPTATRHACHVARALSQHVHIIVRTRYVSEIDELHRLGANQIIPEEFETSIEIFTATLREFHVPPNVIQAQIRLLRQERYSLLRGMKLPGSVVEQLDAILTQGTCDTFLLLQHSPAIGRTLADVGLAGGPGAQAVAVVRGGHAISTLEEDFRLRVADTLVLAGTHGEMEEAFERLSPPAPAPERPGGAPAGGRP